ncbi:uncharacterized protein LOC133830911 isoform X2 [Humulus lupulus]|uniref:uncharacterized protein LOC133830911 isoform X2 n=1 Tax=Humulus lupulus TaxID=3486 RepID=UPI002B40EA01|nr:uncharacterized protein LOC133830911 isoform X2 [Humulus lupulus]
MTHKFLMRGFGTSNLTRPSFCSSQFSREVSPLEVCSIEQSADELKDRYQKLFKGYKKFMCLCAETNFKETFLATVCKRLWINLARSIAKLINLIINCKRFNK